MNQTSVTLRINRGRSVWSVLIVPPLLFFVAIVVASIFFGATAGGDARVIADKVTSAMPMILLIVQALLLAFIWRVLSTEGRGLRNLPWWSSTESTQRRPTLEIVLALGAGALLGVLYALVLSPLMTELQTKWGDYVPPGQTLSSLGTSLLPFFFANVIFAPFVEEVIYRGYALPQLQQRFGDGPALVIVSIFFGLLHWAGGFWYIVLTGLVAGGLFGGLFVSRRSLLIPFAAHLALNLVEFLFVLVGR